MKYLLIIALILPACASVPSGDSKKREVAQCVKDMRAPDDNIGDVFEVCRQIHGLKKVKELK